MPAPRKFDEETVPARSASTPTGCVITASPSWPHSLRRLRQENAELRRANEILTTSSALFAQAELDRRLKKNAAVSKRAGKRRRPAGPSGIPHRRSTPGGRRT